MRKIMTFLMVLCCLAVNAQITLEYCIEKADANYPLLMKYGVIEQTSSIEFSDINKSWLPAIGLYAQGTIQNNVPQFPDAFRGVLDKMGQNLKGLGKFQYKAGVDVSQTVWDGGQSKSQREIARLNAETATAENSVQIYAMHEKVLNIFFGILLVEDQIEQSKNTINLLAANKSKLESLVKNGAALQSDVDMMSAQILTLNQKIIEAENAARGYREVLGLYMDEDISGKSLIRPEKTLPDNLTSNRPELELFDSILKLNNAKYKNIDVSLMPKIGFFAQAYYGYPGIDYFRSMMKRDPSFNIVGGLKVSWNISPLYTKANSKKKIELNSLSTEIERDVFLFNNQLQTKSQKSEIEGLQKVSAKDSEIIQLRENIRKVAESQLNNGAIDMTGLITKITDENQAKLNASYHSTELLYSIYKLKYILNR